MRIISKEKFDTIERLLAARELSQGKIARVVGVLPVTVSHIANGKHAWQRNRISQQPPAPKDKIDTPNPAYVDEDNPWFPGWELHYDEERPYYAPPRSEIAAESRKIRANWPEDDSYIERAQQTAGIRVVSLESIFHASTNGERS